MESNTEQLKEMRKLRNVLEVREKTFEEGNAELYMK